MPHGDSPDEKCTQRKEEGIKVMVLWRKGTSRHFRKSRKDEEGAILCSVLGPVREHDQKIYLFNSIYSKLHAPGHHVLRDGSHPLLYIT